MFRYAVLTLILIAAPMCAIAKSPDHPLLTRFPEARATSHQQVSFERFSLPTGLPPEEASMAFPELSLIGDMTRHTYRIRNTSTLKVYQNYKAAIERAGMNILFECGGEECGNQRQIQDLGAKLAISNSVFTFWQNPYYILAEVDGGKAHVALFIGGNDGEAAVQQVIIEESQVRDDLIDIDLSYLDRPRDLETEIAVITPAQRARDHALLSRYPGARIRERTHSDYEHFSIPVSIVTAARNVDEFEKIELTGELTRHFYELTKVSTLKVYRNYTSALADAGFEILYECSREACGNSTEIRALGALIANTGNVYNYYRDAHYLVAQRDTVKGRAYIALFIGEYRGDTAVQQAIIETGPTEMGLVAVDSDLLHTELEESGKASIEGILFDTGKSTIRPESKPALESVAKLLNDYPQLQFYVVGHTDDVGSPELNLRLSAARAESVVQALVKDFGVTAGRLHSAGMGPYAPLASNTTEEGRTQNRRVELVSRLP